MAALLRLWLAFAVAVLIGGAASAAIPPRPAGPVLDQADVLPPAEEAALDAKLRAYNVATGRAVIVATVASLDGEDIASYTQQLVEAWDIGGKETENGVLLLIAPNERRLRIATARGVQERFTDALSGRIIRDLITPRFKAGDMPGGIAAGVDAIVAQLDRDPADARAVAEAAAAARAQDSREGDGSTIGGIIFWAFMIVVFMAVFGRGGRRGRRFGRGMGSNLPIILWGASEIARGLSHGSGGSGGFGGGGGGGFGGFGGGGGGFNGGGASGGW